jgi:sarcosine oxidase, subunit delta
MMRLHCPWCGARDEAEFSCGGTTHIARPLLDCSDATWGEYLFFRDNPKGLHLERWRHTFGCGQWFNLARDTLSHAVLAVYPIDGRPPPELGH